MSYSPIPNQWCDGVFPRAAVAVICLPKSAEDDQDVKRPLIPAVSRMIPSGVARWPIPGRSGPDP